MVASRSFLPLTLLPLLTAAYTFIDNPAVGGDDENGWTELPPVPGADLISDWPISGTDSTFVVYRSAGLDASAITRAVIVPGAKARDHWSYWITMKNILSYAAEADPSIDPNTISIMSPCFMAQVDQQAGAANSTNLYWSKTGWFSGTYNEGPNAKDQISSFDILDNLAAHYLDKSTYPNLEEIVFAGHSAAAQMFQRYAALRSPIDNDAQIHYIVANPGSFMWLASDRPAPNSSCDDVDRYKYGMNGGFPGYGTGTFNRLGRHGLVEQYLARNVHYAHGTADDGPGDTSCQAVTQGSTHLERGQNFVSLLQSLSTGMPSTQTIDWVEGVSHQNQEMYNSTQLRNRVCCITFFFLFLSLDLYQPTHLRL
ncbi:hypothetical protein K435DRAFT_88044 [Dendrothele bispora CBS 962.96]|uniref:Alpha/beta-hydrolase n=1 Tax=Dendrothele bispora (strain CBS 962.96) TaxID=1314807 RepID=A0A4S8KQG0_DENBC|nr:hypothetical protein K435DRAFT_88044 [Dendrothele bispora CBS 962.96]